MDDTQSSRASDSAATRKRRSSILKSQRPPRTPFSELEFNVATPTDTAKSRRVSFSRRTGVAEFATNEATTTWKNFYEEHNKSLEYSGNVAAERQVGHLGRVFDQQFEEVEADLIPTLNAGPNINISSSLNNFEQQLASLECTDNKITAPNNKFELSSFTNNHTKGFDDLVMPDITDQIDINFSAMQHRIGDNDDLDEIQKDLKENFGCAQFGQNTSEYIEVDLNMTKAINEDDMSITETVLSPKVQDVSNNSKSIDREVDKENIAFNPYVAPNETDNFAINEEPDNVLVFDGKRLTMQSEKNKKEYHRQSTVNSAPQRKTIVLNVNDDLPNFIGDPHASNTSGFIGIADLKKGMILDDLSITDDVNKRTVLYDDNLVDISVTQAVPNVLVADKRLIVEGNSNISTTKSINMLLEKSRSVVIDCKDNNVSVKPKLNDHEREKRTSVFDDNDISIALPIHILPDKTKRRTIVYEDNNLSITQAVPNIQIKEVIIEKRRTIVYEDETGNISVTQAIPSNLIIADKSNDRRRTVVFDSDSGNISVTQALPSCLILQEQLLNTKETKMPTQIVDSSRRRTIVYEDDTGNLSITQAVPNQVIKEITSQNISNASNFNKANNTRTVVFDNDEADISLTQAVPANYVVNSINDMAKIVTIKTEGSNATNKRNTVVFDNDNADISMTQAVSDNHIINAVNIENVLFANDNVNATDIRRTAVSENDYIDISMTQTVSSNQILSAVNKDELKIPKKDYAPDKRRTIVFENDNTDMTMTQTVSSKQILNAVDKNEFQMANVNINAANKIETVVFENDNADILIRQTVPSNQILSAVNTDEFNLANVNVNATDKRRTLVFENDNADISMTQTVSSNHILNEFNKENELGTAKEPNKRKTVVFDNDDADISMTQAVSAYVIQNMYEANQISHNQSNLKDVNKMCHDKSHINSTNKRRTVVFEGEADISKIQENRPQVSVNIHDDLDDALNVALHTRDTNKIHRSLVLNDEDDGVIDEKKLEDNNNKSNLDFTNKRRTVVFEDEADICKIQEKKPQVFINIHDDLDDAINVALHTRDSTKIEGPIVLYDENVAPIEEKKIEKSFNDTSMFLPQSLPNNISADIHLKSQTKSSDELDVSMTNINEERSFFVAEKASTSTIKEVNQEHVNRKSFDAEKQPAHSVTKPIPPTIMINNEKGKDIAIDDVSGGKYSEIVVYQTALSKRTEHGDSQSQEASVILDNEKKSVPKLNADKSVSKLDVDNKLNIEKNDENLSLSSAVVDINVEVVIEPSIEKQVSFVKENNGNSSVANSNEMIKSKSILNDLLDMSQASMEGIDDKNVMAKIERAKENEKVTNGNVCSESSSNDTMFVITDDRDEEEIEAGNQTEIPQIAEHTALSIDYKDTPIAVDLQDTIDDLKAKLAENLNGQYEKVVRSDLATTGYKQKKSFKTANDTNELLQMLNDLTDKTIVQELEPALEEEQPPEPLLIKGHLALENKSEHQPRRLSVAPRRLSVVLSREDILNCISMAGEALKAGIDIDSDLEDTVDSPEVKIHTKYNRISSEVVKSLNFDDSMSEVSTDTKMTPLKKTAFGETSYMQEYKRKVIPDFMKDVSDGIKELMDDLVKPNNDVVPFDSHTVQKKIPSTCSTHIQANLTTSSQVDIIGLHSNPESYYDVDIGKFSSVDMISEAVNRSMSRALKSPIKSVTTTQASEKSLDTETAVPEIKTISPTRRAPETDRVLIFDHNNPLNNVLLVPDAFMEVHKYNPVKSHESCVSERSDAVQVSLHEKTSELERVSTQYNVGNLMHSVHQSGDTISKLDESKSALSNLSRRTSVDQSTCAKLDVKDTEVNTVIAMKGNKELLDASSSLTLVDDALAQSKFDFDIDSNTSQEEMMSPVKVIYTVKTNKKQIESDIQSTSNDEDDKQSNKRTYSAVKREKHKHCTASSLDISPKPMTKMQRLSTSPTSLDVTVDGKPDVETRKDGKASRKPRKKCKKPGTSITVQQLMTEFEVEPMDQETLDEEFNNVLEQCSSVVIPRTPLQCESDCKSPGMVSSFTSSKNLGRASTASSRDSKPSRMDLVHEISSKKSVTEADSSYNVVAKIDMMSFMGSQECEWESSTGDTWSFRLLHARLRLTVRLEHRYDNATRTCVRADTRVRDVALDVLPTESKSMLAVLCVRFAAETMRHFVAQGCSSAGAVPRLVRRCAAAARLAARWGRAMGEARARLAYNVDEEGLLTLKVANIPLRSVWEVSTRLSLVTEEGDAPWVSAGVMTARRVLGARDAAAAPDLTRALHGLPRDWSHAPTAIWRVFKYLKQKTREDGDDLFAGL